MNSTDVSLFIFDANSKGANLSTVVDKLISASQFSMLLQPGKAQQVHSVRRIIKCIENWPSWPSLPWVVAGRVNDTESLGSYDGPFVRDSADETYAQQISQLMALFDWAVFSFFTTYSDEIINVITRFPELGEQAFSSSMCKKALLGTYSSSYPFYPVLKNATFYDYGNEGWLAYQQAIERGEGVPLVLCEMCLDSPELYWHWDNDRNEYDEICWFDEVLCKLELLDELCVTDEYSNTTYRLYRAINAEAYRQLWSMASDDRSIVEATFAADCDIAQLKQYLSKGYFDIIRHTESVASWAYGLMYGGGADEHLTIFHARDAAITQQLWQVLGKSVISRF